MKYVVYIMWLPLVACQMTHKPSLEKVQATAKVEVQKRMDELEKENLELQLRNSILTKALKERRGAPATAKTQISTPVAKVKKGQPFPQFDELIFDQAKTAFENKDVERLVEALRILRANHAESRYLPKIYIWLSDVQIQKTQYSQALITLDEFVKSYPQNEDSARALSLKGKLYQKLNLEIQAQEVYKTIQEKYPHSKEKEVADQQLQELKKGTIR